MRTKPKIPISIKSAVAVDKYLLLPDGHRTTLVAGMMEMLNYSILFCSSEKQPNLMRLLEYSNSLNPDALRKILDEYFQADVTRQQFAIAPSFVAALGERF